MISLTGLVAGLVIGIGFVIMQEQFGMIKMPGHFIVQAYPVVISWIDVLLVTVGVAVVGYFIALLPVSILSKRR
jgi:ABC-type antimicrobial peptide transport system permease subunit